MMQTSNKRVKERQRAIREETKEGGKLERRKTINSQKQKKEREREKTRRKKGRVSE